MCPQTSHERMNKASSQTLTGLRAAVLGSTSGIGRSIALALAEAGGAVIIHGRRSRERAEAVSSECRQRGASRTAVLLADLADAPAYHEVYSQYFGPVMPASTTVQQIAPAERKADQNDHYTELEQISLIAVRKSAR